MANRFGVSTMLYRWFIGVYQKCFSRRCEHNPFATKCTHDSTSVVTGYEIVELEFDMTKVTPINPTERRMYVRHRAKTNVHIKPIGCTTATMRRAANLSANGVAVVTEGMGLKIGQAVELSFSVNLGTVTKLHRRKAIVAHVTKGVTGFYMEAFTG